MAKTDLDDLVGGLDLSGFTGDDFVAMRDRNTDKADMIKVSIDELVANESQVRKTFHQDALDELVASIRVNGLLMPLNVIRQGGRKYLIQAGERRFRALSIIAKNPMPDDKVDVEAIPVFVRGDEGEESGIVRDVVSMVENDHRQDISEAERALLVYRALQQGFEMSELRKRLQVTAPRLSQLNRIGKVFPEWFLLEAAQRQFRQAVFADLIKKTKPFAEDATVFDSKLKQFIDDFDCLLKDMGKQSAAAKKALEKMASTEDSGEQKGKTKKTKKEETVISLENGTLKYHAAANKTYSVQLCGVSFEQLEKVCAALGVETCQKVDG